MAEYDTCPECSGLREDQTTGMPCWRCGGTGEVEWDPSGDEDDDGE